MKTNYLMLAAFAASVHAHSGVVLSYFNADVVANNVKFQWATESEDNSMLFQVQRSTDGGQFWFTVSSLEGSGNSNIAVEYEKLDSNPLPGTNTYRLRQLDVSGVAWSSEAITATITSVGPELELRIFPNPTSEMVGIKLSTNWIGSISVQNAVGQTVIEEVVVDGSRFEINIEALPKGYYYVQFRDGENKMTKKFLKE